MCMFAAAMVSCASFPVDIIISILVWAHTDNTLRCITSRCGICNWLSKELPGPFQVYSFNSDLYMELVAKLILTTRRPRPMAPGIDMVITFSLQNSVLQLGALFFYVQLLALGPACPFGALLSERKVCLFKVPFLSTTVDRIAGPKQ